MDEALSRLKRVFGPEQGTAVYQELLTLLAVADLSEPDDEMAFADLLIDRGGLHEAVGRSLRIRSILRGAKMTRWADRRVHPNQNQPAPASEPADTHEKGRKPSLS